MDDQQRSLEIRFEGLPVAEAGKKAEMLRKELAGITPDATVRITKDDQTNMDFGATIVLALGTPAIFAIAKGIASYLSRERGTITISSKGDVLCTGISGDDQAKIAEAFAKQRKP